MKKILTLLFLGATFFSFSQNSYQLELTSFNDRHPKEVFEDISTRLDYTSRHIKEGVLTFQSNENYSTEKILRIVESFGYTIKSFKLIEGEKEKVLFEK